MYVKDNTVFKRVLIVRALYGLANTFRVLACANNIATKTNRQLIVVRHKSKYTYSTTDFFDWGIIGAILINEDEIPDNIDVYFLENNQNTHIQSSKILVLNRLDDFTFESSPLINCTKDVIYVESCSSLCTVDQLKNYVHTMREFYSKLLLKQYILQSFNEYVSTILPEGDFTAVHIRRDDLHRYRICKENYKIDKYKILADSFGNNIKILCTDDKKVQKTLMGEYISINTPVTFKDGDALFDFLLLSKASHIVGTLGSSYAIEAFCFGSNGKDLVTVGSNIEPFNVPYVSYYISEIASNILFILFLIIDIMLAIYVVKSKRYKKRIFILFIIILLILIALSSTMYVYDRKHRLVSEYHIN